MPFNAEQLAYAGRHVIDFHLKTDPIDQVNTERPLIKRLMGEKKPYVGGLQYVTERLRFSNDSNFQAYFGDSQVSYNRKRTLQQVKYTWASLHDGFGLNEDELAQAGITYTDDKNAVATGAEKVMLQNLLSENMETLKLGFQENFDIMLHRDGTQSALELAGLDALVATDPSADTVGGIPSASNAWWKNLANTGISTASAGNLVDQMEIAYRACIRVGGRPPNFLLCGSAFLDAYRNDATNTINRQLNIQGKGGTSIDAGISGVFFKGIELVWDPVFEVMDALDSPAIPWEKRCYFLNTNHLKLRPITGHWMVPRKPPRVYDRYVHYWAITAKAALTTNKRNAHAVLSIA